MSRSATINRNTGETDITVTLELDGSGKTNIDTGIGFLDHMLDCFARHGLFDISVSCKGDLKVDSHHTAEDIGIVIGQTIREAVGDKAGIRRYGSCLLPMDDALVLCAIDLSGRPYMNFNVNFTAERLGELDTEMIRDFFYAVTYQSNINLHLKQLDGFNNHHLAEACFKAFAKALDCATLYEERIDGVWSTKGSL